MENKQPKMQITLKIAHTNMNICEAQSLRRRAVVVVVVVLVRADQCLGATVLFYSLSLPSYSAMTSNYRQVANLPPQEQTGSGVERRRFHYSAQLQI